MTEVSDKVDGCSDNIGMTRTASTVVQARPLCPLIGFEVWLVAITRGSSGRSHGCATHHAQWHKHNWRNIDGFGHNLDPAGLLGCPAQLSVNGASGPRTGKSAGDGHHQVRGRDVLLRGGLR
jgi:hypothetical protein